MYGKYCAFDYVWSEWCCEDCGECDFFCGGFALEVEDFGGFFGGWHGFYRPCGDSSEMCVICGGVSMISLGGRAGMRMRMQRFSGPGMLPWMRM